MKSAEEMDAHVWFMRFDEGTATPEGFAAWLEARDAAKKAEGYRAGLERAGNLHESVPNYCDRHSDTRHCCEAMGAIIRYRDLIRSEIA